MAIDKNDPEVRALIDAEVEALKRTNAELKEEKKKLANRTLSEDELEEFNALREAREANEAKKGDLESQIARLTKKHTNEIEAANAKVQALTKKLEQNLLDSAAMKAINDAGGNVDLLMPHVRSRMKLAEVDGDFVVQVSDGTGAIIEATEVDLVNEYKAKPSFASAFKATITPGGGAKPGVTEANIVNPYRKETRNLSEQGRLEKFDPVLAARLRQEAGQ
ncbi:hypothetical protein [Escherichia coli]|uniref:hypothetical protein n=1 Tax=Escherichia coli TaxID=562 RepID=UPI000E20D801|nr:hypothetical protein [Escherichia coli]